jgi:tRNA pseudouridine65 synthase
MLEIIFEDESIVVINKPHGLLVHRSSIASNTNEFAVQILRDQIGSYVYPIHRLDRKTSGVLLFSKSKKLIPLLQKMFAERQVHKTYYAILRGFAADEGVINYALCNDKGKKQEAITQYKTLKRVELDIPFGQHATSRYSLVKAYPQTGRMHQLRKHFAHIMHPIIGDRPHGCNKQNKLFLEKWNMSTMLLHAKKLEINHPISDQLLAFEAQESAEFLRMLNILKLA